MSVLLAAFGLAFGKLGALSRKKSSGVASLLLLANATDHLLLANGSDRLVLAGNPF